MGDIPQDLVDRMMVKCARRCCICRRFRPTKLQVHHIVERSDGGSDDEDNLIVVCLSCHTDVHTKVPFARRFSVDELKGHRDALVQLVAEGRLPAGDSEDSDGVIARVLEVARASHRDSGTLSTEAMEVLLAAVASEGPSQGNVHAIQHDSGFVVMVGSGTAFDSEDRRIQAKYRQAVEELIQNRFLRHLSAELYEVTAEGYLAADDLAVGGS